MTLFLKILGLVLWAIGGFIWRLVPTAPYSNALIAAGLFFFFLPDVLPIGK